MTELTAVLDAGRQAFARGDWHEAHRHLTAARRIGPLSTADLDLLSRTAWWVREVRASVEISEEVYQRFQHDGDLIGATRKALNLAMLWYIRGDLVIASGWLNRARGLLDQIPGVRRARLPALPGRVGRAGHLRAGPRPRDRRGPQGHGCQAAGAAADVAGPGAVRADECAHRRSGDRLRPASTRRCCPCWQDLPPEWAGSIYCTVINTCHHLGDLGRMRAWTAATQHWTQQFQGEVVFSGICRIHRFQLLTTEGDWTTAEAGIERSGADLVGINEWVAGEAYYQLAEIRRLRGDVQGARAALDRARDLGAEIQPGAALLDLSLGRAREASAALRAAMAGSERLARARMLAPAVEIAIAEGDLEGADRLCQDLEAIAADFATEGFRAWALQARAAVLVAQQRHDEALPVLRQAARCYRAMRARYETARVYELCAHAHAGLSDPAAAESDRATALSIYRELGAAPDVTRLGGATGLPGGLTHREAEVLRLIAAGASNRDAAAALFISAKTVDRHLGNIFAKIGVTSRTAAAAWAHEHRLSGR